MVGAVEVREMVVVMTVVSGNRDQHTYRAGCRVKFELACRL